ncbi:hypothetical protein Bca4012_086745 [Brassica carinata]
MQEESSEFRKERQRDRGEQSRRSNGAGKTTRISAGDNDALRSHHFPETKPAVHGWRRKRGRRNQSRSDETETGNRNTYGLSHSEKQDQPL